MRYSVLDQFLGDSSSRPTTVFLQLYYVLSTASKDVMNLLLSYTGQISSIKTGIPCCRKHKTVKNSVCKLNSGSCCLSYTFKARLMAAQQLLDLAYVFPPKLHCKIPK